MADRRFACSEQKIGILLDHMEAGAENTSFEGSSDTHGGANFETQPPHNWKHESGISVSTSDAGDFTAVPPFPAFADSVPPARIRVLADGSLRRTSMTGASDLPSLLVSPSPPA